MRQPALKHAKNIDLLDIYYIEMDVFNSFSNKEIPKLSLTLGCVLWYRVYQGIRYLQIVHYKNQSKLKLKFEPKSDKVTACISIDYGKKLSNGLRERMNRVPQPRVGARVYRVFTGYTARI